MKKGRSSRSRRSAFLMLLGAWKLNWVCLALSPVALFLLIVYSYMKRFTFLCHLVLGVTCACAPVGAWLAVTENLRSCR